LTAMSREKISAARVKVIARPKRAVQVGTQGVRATPSEPSKETIGACYHAGDKAQAGKQRVAAYCRVSTLAEEQELSFETQCDHYRERIERDPQMALIGVYGDHGITGLSTEKRPAFKRLMRDCMDGKVDLVLTKSISRFARNLVDCIENVGKLREKGIPVIFEREDLNTMDRNCDMVLSILASIAQEEINSMSQNIRWGHERRNASGTPARRARYGYRKTSDAQARWTIHEQEAKRVRLAFRMAEQGSTYKEILRELDAMETRDGTGVTWSVARVREMLRSEVYIGDVLTNKYYTPDYLTGKVRKNRGEQPQYYIEGHHEGIVDKQTFTIVGRIQRCGALSSQSSPERRERMLRWARAVDNVPDSTNDERTAEKKEDQA